jgi:hypothetical protein
MDKLVLKHAAELLRTASEEFSNHGCNDYPLENTPENREFAKKVFKTSCGEDLDVPDDAKKIFLQDWIVMSYCARVLEAESK